MAPVATGPTPALANGNGGFQIGPAGGEPQFRTQSAPPATLAADATMTAANILGRIIVTSTGAVAATLPLATDLDIALPNCPVDGSFDFSVISLTGGGTCTVTTNTGWTLVGTMTVATATATLFRARKTAAGAWTLYRVG